MTENKKTVQKLIKGNKSDVVTEINESIYWMSKHIQRLEARITQLEQITKHLRPL